MALVTVQLAFPHVLPLRPSVPLVPVGTSGQACTRFVYRRWHKSVCHWLGREKFGWSSRDGIICGAIEAEASVEAAGRDRGNGGRAVVCARVQFVAVGSSRARR